MKTLFVIRHGKSSWDHPELSDKERPLKKRGLNDGKVMGSVLNKLGVTPDLLISSPAKRAFATACLIAGELGYDQQNIKKNDRLYFEGSESYIDILNDLNEENNVVFLFSHNPDITNFANRFSRDRIDNVPTTGTICIEFDVDSWKQVDISKGRLKFFDYPSRHR